eukprot:Colp12_sorted_trinity150504_noHs@27453
MAPKLTYFNFKARAESARLCFHIGGIEFVDERISFEEFGKNKAEGKYPFGQLPILTLDDGTVIAQSTAIARYAAKLAGLYSTDAVKAAKIDEAIAAVEDLGSAISVSIHEKDAEKKAQMRAELASVTIPKWIGFFENLIRKNGESGYLVGDSITLADIHAVNNFSWVARGVLDGIPPTLITDSKIISNLMHLVNSHPKIAEWNAAHP